MAASAQAATVTVGSPLTAAFHPGSSSGVGTLTIAALPESGAQVTSPVTGTIVRWRITQASGTWRLRVLTPAGGSNYTGAGTSGAQTPSSTATQTYSTIIPIRAGQTIGIDNTTSSDQLGVAIVPGAAFLAFAPRTPDGSTRTATAAHSKRELGFNADVQPFPSVSSLSPSSGSTAGGTTVTIRGQNFEGTTAVSFGGTPAASFTALSDNVITAVTRPRSAGTVDVTVKNPGQSPKVAADRFTFVKRCVVPKLKGKTLKAARKALRKAHCKLGKVKGPKGKKARITKQKTKAGKVLKAGSKVKVTTR